MDVKAIPILDVAAALDISVNEKGYCRCLRNEDKTPSMHFNPEENLWNCFSCVQGGSCIDLVMHAKGMDVVGAISWLEETFAGKFPIAAPRIQKDEPSPKPDRDFSEIYQLVIDMGELPAEATEYLTTKRGIKKDVVEAWGVRYYSPVQRQKVAEALKAKFKLDDLEAAGLMSWSKKGNQHYYTFWSCNFIFPFWCGNQIVHLQGRNEKEGGKYLNLANRRATWPYGINVLEGITEGSVVYLAEGLFDTLTLISIGLLAIGIPGVGHFITDYKKILSGFKVRFISQNDPRRTPGQPTAAEALECKIRELIPEARIFHIPAQYKDLNDWHVAIQGGLSKELLERELLEVQASTCSNDAEKTSKLKERPRIELVTASQRATGLITNLRISLDQALAAGHTRAERNLIKTGIEEFDGLLNGGLRSGLYGLAASPGLGKTTLTLILTRKITAISNRKVIYFLLEMSTGEILAILLAWGAGINKLCILDQAVSAEELRSIDELVTYSDYLDNLYLVDDATNVGDVATVLDGFMADDKMAPPLVVLDYLQILQPMPNFRPRDERSSQKHTVYELKKLSSRYNVPMLIISSVPRDFYRNMKNEKKPDILASFKEAGDIEFALSAGFYLETVAGLELPDCQRPLRLHMVKNRWGRCHDAAGEYLHFDFALDFLTGEITPWDFRDRSEAAEADEVRL